MFLLASNCALLLILRVFLRLCLRILFDILFPFSLGLMLRYSGNRPVYFSTCLFVISCNFANISLHWPSFSIKLLSILFTFVVSARRLGFDCMTLLFLAVSFNERCEVEACAKYNVANNPDFTFCFNSLVESLACPVMKTLQVYTAAENCKQEK